MKRPTFRIAVLIGALSALAPAIACAEVFVSGTLTWPNGAPAAGMELDLRPSNAGDASTPPSRTFSNLAGKFGFFDLTGRPVDYIVIVKDGAGRELARFSLEEYMRTNGLGDLPVGSKISLVVTGR